MYVVEANVGKAKTEQVARANIRKVRHSLSGKPLVGFSEINEGGAGDEWEMIEVEFPSTKPHSHQYEYMGERTHQPVCVPSGWPIVEQHITPIHDGIARVTPARQVVSGTMKRHTLQFADVNLHFLNGKDRNERLKALWDLSIDVSRTVVAEYIDAGIPVIWQGDANADGRMPRLHREEVRVVNAYNDFMAYVPVDGATRIQVKGTGKIDLTIDGHNAHWMRVEFSP